MQDLSSERELDTTFLFLSSHNQDIPQPQGFFRREQGEPRIDNSALLICRMDTDCTAAHAETLEMTQRACLMVSFSSRRQHCSGSTNFADRFYISSLDDVHAQTVTS
jgi:hypothetical protein